MIRYKEIFILGTLGLFFGCNPNTGHRTSTVDSLKTVEHNQQQLKDNKSGHYVFQNQNDTIDLKLVIEGTQVRGTLLYSLAEKDKNSGDIVGVLTDDLIVADYEFASEGTMSVRQVAFKFVKDDLAEGYGDMIEKDGKMVFKDLKTLNYNDSMRLRKQ